MASPERAQERSSEKARGLAFSLFGIPVRVASSFWIIALLFGTDTGGTSATGRVIAQALIWTGIVFVSILLHELGHAAAARAFGASPSITLHAMGGLTQFESGPFSRLQRWLISFAGPAMGLVVGTAVWVTAHFFPVSTVDAERAIDAVLWVNIGWSVVNLLPVLPFDGGQMMSAFLGPRRELWTAIISAVVGASVAILGYARLGNLWVAFLFGSATVGALRQVRWHWHTKADRDAGLEEELGLARAGIAHGDAASVLARGEKIVTLARTTQMKNAGFFVQAWALATLNRKVQAREIIEKLEREVPADPYLIAAVEDALGSPERARAWLEAERKQGIHRTESVKLLIDLYARAGELERAVDVATEAVEVLSEEDARAVHAAALAGGATGEAGRLQEAIERVFGKRERTPQDPAEPAAVPPRSS